MITNAIRTVRAIESGVRQRVTRSSDSKEHNPSSTEEWTIALRGELCDTLGVFNEQRRQLAATQPPQDSLERGSILEDNVHVMYTDVEPALVLITVCYFLIITLLSCPLTTCLVDCVSIVCPRTSETTRLI
jgi:hypothetical protein